MEKNHFSHFAERSFTKSFGILADGSEVFCVTLINNHGVEVSILTYGATISSLKIPVGNEKIDVVLGFETLADYVDSFNLESAPYLGAAVGPFAGRIKNGNFNLNDRNYQLDKNLGDNHLHGGFNGLSQRVWEIKNVNADENPSVTLIQVGGQDENNYPGKLTVEVTYSLTESNELKVNFQANSSDDTIVNLTQHSYFNLEGHSKDITRQKLFVNSDQLLEVDDQNIPTGILMEINNTLFDYSKFRNCPIFIDNTFVLNDNQKPAAAFYSDETKLKLTVYTDQPGIHIYVGGNCFGKIEGKEKADYHTQSGICFETQNFPDAPNHANFPSAILKKDALYRHETTFKFENL